MLELFFLPIQPFIWHPERAFIVAIVFSILWIFIRKKVWSFGSVPLLLAAISWGLFAAWETYVYSIKANIRIDLFIIYPWLLIITLYPIVFIFDTKGVREKSNKT